MELEHIIKLIDHEITKVQNRDIADSNDEARKAGELQGLQDLRQTISHLKGQDDVIIESITDLSINERKAVRMLKKSEQTMINAVNEHKKCLHTVFQEFLKNHSLDNWVKRKSDNLTSIGKILIAETNDISHPVVMLFCKVKSTDDGFASEEFNRKETDYLIALADILNKFESVKGVEE